MWCLNLVTLEGEKMKIFTEMPFQHIMPPQLIHSNYNSAHRCLNLALTALPHETHVSHKFNCDESRKKKKIQNQVMSFLQCTPKKYVTVFTARQKTISMPSGHMSEFPSSLPISILLGCDTRPDVAAPLTSRVSLLTGFVDCSSQGQEGRCGVGAHGGCTHDVS